MRPPAIEPSPRWRDQSADGFRCGGRRRVMHDRTTGTALLAGFTGRLGRAGYWSAVFVGVFGCCFALFAWAIALGLAFGTGVRSVDVGFLGVFSIPPSWPFSVSFGDPAATAQAGLLSALFYVGGTAVYVAGFGYLASATLRRLHDRNRGGWWMAPLLIGPALLNGLAERVDHGVLAGVLGGIGFGLGVWGFLELLVLRGTAGPNRFGRDPLADAGPAGAARWDQHSELECVPHRAAPSPSRPAD